MSDIFRALSEGDLNEILSGDHSKDYWKDNKYMCIEIFANISSINVIGYDSKMELTGILKELEDAYTGVVE